jgi:hypothetical protein
MHAACLVAEFESHEAARVGIDVLRKFDFHADAISVAWKGHTKALEKVDRGNDQEDPYEIEKSMGIGAAIAAMVGTPLAITTVMGPIMIAGPIAAVVGGAAIGAAATEIKHFQKPHHSSSDRVDSRGLFAMANHFGISSHSAADYEKRISEGAILLIVTSTPPRLDEAQHGLKTTNPASLQRFEFRHA